MDRFLAYVIGLGLAYTIMIIFILAMPSNKVSKLVYMNHVENETASIISAVDTPEKVQVYSAIPKDGVGALHIPSCGVNAIIRYGTTEWAFADKHVGEYKGSGDIGEGNYVLLGHARAGKDYVFTNLESTISIGDSVYVQKNGTLYHFRVFSTEVVTPDATYVMDDNGDPECTLICCTDNGVNRFVVYCEYVDEEQMEGEMLIDK